LKWNEQISKDREVKLWMITYQLLDEIAEESLHTSRLDVLEQVTVATCVLLSRNQQPIQNPLLSMMGFYHSK
jgi:hypothetical protein